MNLFIKFMNSRHTIFLSLLFHCSVQVVYWGLRLATRGRLSKFNLCTVTIINFLNSYLNGIFVRESDSKNRIIASVKGLPYMVPSVCKGLVYGILGPIGTYRITLGIYRSARTKDLKWSQPPFTLGFDKENKKYIMYPYGNATWLFPIKKDH